MILFSFLIFSLLNFDFTIFTFWYSIKYLGNKDWHFMNSQDYFMNWSLMNSQPTFLFLPTFNSINYGYIIKRCKSDNFESHNSLKHSFTNIRELYSNFVECESFLESNSPSILFLCETNLMTQLILAISL